MKKTVLKNLSAMAIFFGILTSASAEASQSQFARILTDDVLNATVKAYEVKNQKTCFYPEEGDIQWRCLNGPGCGYTLFISCTSNAFSGNEAIRTLIEIRGFDTGTENQISQITFKNRSNR